VSQRSDDALWGSDNQQLARVARNVATRYMAIIVDGLLGLVILPFNVRHLGTSAYGLWMLTASVTLYFSVLDLGFGGSITKFVAQYRARRDARSLNEIVSTLFVAFTMIGIFAYVLFLTLAWHIDRVFNLSPDQVSTARFLMLIVGVYVAVSFPANIFGGVINGFQRYNVNSVVGTASSLVVAVVNVLMLLLGFSLVELVAATTAVRIVTYLFYAWNAFSTFPALSITPTLFRWSRLSEVTTFSVYISILDWAQKLNYSADAIVIGAFMSSAAVAVWTVPQRVAEMLQRLTNQLNGVLFPVVVDSHAGSKPDLLRAVFLHGTRISVLSVAPLAAIALLLAKPLIGSWVGPRFADAVPVLQILMLVVAIRVGNSSATTVLKGAGRHRFLALTNLSMALANVALSVLWIRPYGLIGQAFGTFVPIATVSILVLWPAACRRVDIGVTAAFRDAVWPALWPVVAPVALLLPTRDLLPVRFDAVAATGTAALACYLVIYLAFAVKADERRLYLSKMSQLARARRTVAAAA
jgi:O-antigen/teichoic acid export membrane protein